MTERTTLGDLAGLSHEGRYKWILERTESFLHETLSQLRRDKAAFADSLQPERLAWALAFNCEEYLKLKGAQTPWTSLWSDTEKGSAMPQPRLRDLALSVACENREDWQPASARPIRVADAKIAFNFLYSENNSKVNQAVAGALARKHAGMGANRTALADEAWAEVYLRYWSKTANRRFLGLCRISSFVATVAGRIADRQLGTESKMISDETVLNNLEDELSLEKDLLNQDLSGHLRQCIDQLAPRMRLFAWTRWIDEVDQTTIAKTYLVSEAAVSQSLASAKGRLRDCLQSRGILGSQRDEKKVGKSQSWG
jgi:RNA polymerase sigma factor (sigma-70 family)